MNDTSNPAAIDSSLSPKDIEQMNLPYTLAAKKLSHFKRGNIKKHLRNLSIVIDSTVAKFPPEVRRTIQARFPQPPTITILDVAPVIQAGHMSPGCAEFDARGEFKGLILSPQLLFAPIEVTSQIIAHEYAHVYLRILGKKYLGMNIPPDCDIRTEYCHDLPMLEEELEVDRLTIQWGFGDRNEYTYWETAVFYAKTLECDDIYRMYRAHLPKAK